jgi:tRNA (cmo5U34)-methyltransferase
MEVDFMQKSVKQMFDAAAGEYDRERRQLIPCFDDFYGTALSLIEMDHPSPRILDLGAGTGLFSAFIVQKYPDARLTLIDFSESMLERARRRFAGNPHMQYIAADYTRHSFAETYDAVVSSLSIHHLSHDEKCKLFAAVYGILREGGIFVNADQVQGNTPAADAYYRKRWLEAIRQSGLSEEAIQASIERRKLDVNAKLADQLQWLEEAGFADADCVYKHMDFAVFYGRK